MPLAAGEKLGPYEILAPLGAGGMGEVYRARDPRLNRDVAIKVSKDQFSERFEREARAVAALNHPNICQIYDVGPNYLVMEFIEGDSPQGPLSLEETLRIARQIAAALEAAHDRGIVHRDLKPANIKLKHDGTVKVLDFGLAKIADAPEALSQDSPTLTMAATQAGVILGTAAYMSPEQARGKRVDKRADIWAFGVVVYEILTGDRLFHGETVADTLIEVATKQPDWDRVPGSLLPLLQKCLQKDPAKRLRDIGDMELLLNQASASPATAPVLQSRGYAWPAGAGVFALALAALAFVHFREPQPPAPEMTRFQIPAPEKSTFNNALQISPDGRKLAFAASGEGGNRLWVRSLDSLEAKPVAAWTQNPGLFWSPDSRFVVYQENGKLKKVDATGGPPVSLCDAPIAFGGGAWSSAGVIVFGNRGGGLMQVSASGGVPTALTNLDQARAEFSHGFPSFLPDGRHFMYLRRSRDAEKTGIYLGSIDLKPEQQDSRPVLLTSEAAVYTPGPDPREATKGLGLVLFAREQTLMAQPFDARKLALAGEPVPVAEHVGAAGYGYSHFTASDTGVLAFRAGGGGLGSITQLTWFDRGGKELGTAGQPAIYNSFSISPDGKRIAAEETDTKGSDLWLIDSASGGKSERFTFDPGGESAPVWSPDGSKILYSSTHSGAPNLYWKKSNGAGSEEEFFKAPNQEYPNDWSRDGHTVIYFDVDPKTGPDILFMSADEHAERKPSPFLVTPFQELRGRLSPDGRWLAYQSTESGRNEIYVQPFPPSADRTGKHLISNGGGTQPLWRRDGKEIFFVQGAQIMAAQVSAGTVFSASPAKQLFEKSPAIAGNGGGYFWDVTGDGQRVLLRVPMGEANQQEPITLEQNWMAALRK